MSPFIEIMSTNSSSHPLRGMRVQVSVLKVEDEGAIIACGQDWSPGMGFGPTNTYPLE